MPAVELRQSKLHCSLQIDAVCSAHCRRHVRRRTVPRKQPSIDCMARLPSPRRPGDLPPRRTGCTAPHFHWLRTAWVAREHVPEDNPSHCFPLVRRRERKRRTQSCEKAARQCGRQRHNHNVQGRESLWGATLHAPLRENSNLRSVRDSGSVSQAENGKNTKVRTKIIIFGSFAVSFIPFIRGRRGPGRVVPRSAAIEVCAARCSTASEAGTGNGRSIDKERDNFEQ